MFKKLLAAGTAIALGFLAVHLYDPPRHTYNTLDRSTVAIGNYCSGVVIDDPIESDGIQHTVLTASHCVGPEKVGDKVKVFEDGIGFEFTLIDKTKQYDLAVLQMEYNADFSKVTDIANLGIDAEFGERVLVAGFPWIGNDWLQQQITEGLAGDIQWINYATWMTYRYLQYVTAWALPGNSGGPVFSYDIFKGYEVVGILVGGYPIPYNWMVPISTVHTYLDTLGEGS